MPRLIFDGALLEGSSTIAISLCMASGCVLALTNKLSNTSVKLLITGAVLTLPTSGQIAALGHRRGAISKSWLVAVPILAIMLLAGCSDGSADWDSGADSYPDPGAYGNTQSDSNAHTCTDGPAHGHQRQSAH